MQVRGNKKILILIHGVEILPKFLFCVIAGQTVWMY